MLNKAVRDEKYFNDLKIFMINIYGLKITKITEAKRGFFGETWRFETNTSTYFVKIDYCDYHKGIYQSTDRLCYYCYYSFFYYLIEYLMAYFYVKTEIDKQDLADSVFEYFNSWIFTQLNASDNG